MTNRIDLSGKVFGRLTAVSAAPNSKSGQTAWHCQCECGNTTVTTSMNLVRGRARSCGCLQREIVSRKSTTHGKAHTPTWWTWRGMVSRCSVPTNGSFPNYGGRGIVVCERWKRFENFLEDMGERPENKTLDRIDNNGNYEPSNCRWATKAEQVRNKRTTVKVEFNGRTMTYSEWARELGEDPGALRRRYLRTGQLTPRMEKLRDH